MGRIKQVAKAARLLQAWGFWSRQDHSGGLYCVHTGYVLLCTRDIQWSWISSRARLRMRTALSKELAVESLMI